MAFFTDCVMAQYGGFVIGQALKFPNFTCLYEFSDTVADAVVNACIPFHAAAGRQQYCECFYGGQTADDIFRMLLDADYSADRCFNVAVAWCLATPRRTIDNRLAVNDSDNRIVVVHQVAARNGGVPQVCVRALACATGRCHKVAIAVAAYYTGMDK